MTALEPAPPGVPAHATDHTGGETASPTGDGTTGDGTTGDGTTGARAGHAERMARIALCQLGEPGDLRVAGLVAELGAVRAFDLLASGHGTTRRAGVVDAPPIQDDVVTRLADIEPERDHEQARRRGIRFVVPGDEEWPDQLDDLGEAPAHLDMGGPPLGLWVRGPVQLHRLRTAVAVVGSRSSTTYGDEVAAEIASALGRAGRVVVSGAAYGIDVAAHRGAVSAGGRTVAVLACGVDRAYPLSHRPLLDHLAREGAIISELAPGRAPMRARFLSRNRVIAALGVGTVVAEAARRSGALHTAGWAARLNRVVLGVPGPVTSAQSQGVHELVRSGAAALATCGAEVLEAVSPSGSALVEPQRGPEKARDRVSRRDQRVLDAVPLATGVGVDSIAHTAGMGLLEVRSALGRLEARGLARHDGQGWRLSPTAVR